MYFLKNIFIKTIYIFIGILILAKVIFGISEGAKSLGVGNIQSVILSDVNSLFNNPANLNSINNLSIMASYISLYNIEDLYNLKFGFVYPLKDFKIGAGIKFLKFENLYNFSQYSIALGLPFKKYFNFGIAFSYLLNQVKLENDEIKDIRNSVGKLSLSLGLTFNINEYILIGGFCRNLNNPNLNFSKKFDNKNEIREFRAGLKLNIVKNFAFLIEEKFIRGREPETLIGTQLNFYDTIIAFAGLNKTQNVTTGFGLYLKNFNIEFGLNSGSELGYIYQIDVTVKL